MKLLKMRPRAVLYVAYPLLPVTDASCGGAEQVLLTLERALSRRGWATTTAACSGSEMSGVVYTTGHAGNGSLAAAEWHEARHAQKIIELVAVRDAIGRGFELIHDHSGSFFNRAHDVDVPLLATLHLPRSFYPESFFARRPRNLYFNCVSESQCKHFADVPQMLGAIPNGIQLERFALETRKHDYLLWLGRICHEKGAHVALDAAHDAGVPIIMAGKVYPFAYHQQYFEREIVPRLQRMGSNARFVDSPSLADKIALLRGARAVLVSSLAEETSSLVAMEAAACGTPVIACRRGALPEVIDDGETGILVNNKDEMVRAVTRVKRIHPRICHAYAQRNFSSTRMADGYQALYERVAKEKRTRQPERIAA
jgi:glycosyltransferase involved in cell wall biosynthesis